jgi:hypothetical protein
VKATESLEATKPACTVTGAWPGGPVGTVTTTLVSDHDTTVASIPPTMTIPGVIPKPVPEIVARVPPAAGPDNGEMLITDGITGT